MMFVCNLPSGGSRGKGFDHECKRRRIHGGHGSCSTRARSTTGKRGSGPPIVFVHGAIANGRLWTGVAPELAGGHRCIVPDWPMGSHPEAMNPDADLSPRGQARLIERVPAPPSTSTT